MEPKTIEKKKFEYKWVILAVCFLMVFICLGFCSSNKSRYFKAIADAQGIERSALSISDTIRFLVSACINFFFGTLVLKFGVRKLVAFGFGAVLGAVACFGYGESLPVFYLGGALLGAGLAFTTTAVASIMVKRWFTGKTGTILGIVLAANGLGGAVAAQIVGPIIDSGDFGYRKAYTLVLCIVAAMGVLAVCLLREKPRDHQGELVVKNQKKARGGGWVGVELSAAKKQGYFIPSLIGIFLTGMVLSGVNGIGSAHLKDMGLDGGYVDDVVSIHSLVLLFSKMLAGVLYDKKGLRAMLSLCNAVGAVSMFALALVGQTTLGLVMAMVWGITSSISLPMETIGVTLVASDLYGNKAFDKLLGIMLALNHLGYAVGGYIINIIFDATGSYAPGAVVYGVILLAVTVMYQFIITAAHRVRKEVEAEV